MAPRCESKQKMPPRVTGSLPSSLPLLGNERGSVLAMMVVMLVALLGMAALAIDFGMLYSARGEAQRSADSGALAGAGVLLLAPGDWDRARASAREYSEFNHVRWGLVEVLDEDIDVVADSQKVRVRVLLNSTRGNPVYTLFARALGIETVDISVSAAAQTWPSDRTDCMLPFAIPDRWDVYEGGTYRPSRSGDVYDEARGDRYFSPAAPREDGYYTGYGGRNIGEPFLLKPKSPAGTPQPEWYYPHSAHERTGCARLSRRDSRLLGARRRHRDRRHGRFRAREHGGADQAGVPGHPQRSRGTGPVLG